MPSIHSFNRYVEYSHEIKCSKEHIWSVISSPGNLEKFHPFCSKNDVFSWNGSHASDQLTYLNGRTLERHFCSWKDHEGYDLWIGRKGGKQSFVSWRISSTQDSTQCRVTIRIYPHFYNTGHSILQAPLFYFFIRSPLVAYLKSVLNGLDFYCIRNVNVTKNQFGTHRWFS